MSDKPYHHWKRGLREVRTDVHHILTGEAIIGADHIHLSIWLYQEGHRGRPHQTSATVRRGLDDPTCRHERPHVFPPVTVIELRHAQLGVLWYFFDETVLKLLDHIFRNGNTCAAACIPSSLESGCPLKLSCLCGALLAAQLSRKFDVLGVEPGMSAGVELIIDFEDPALNVGVARDEASKRRVELLLRVDVVGCKGSRYVSLLEDAFSSALC